MYGSARSVGKVEPSNQSPGRSPRLPRSPRLGHRRTNSTGGSSGSSVGGGSGKTLSMENIQSLNAAYATSGPMYLSDHENVGSETPKSTMTLGRSGGRLPYGVRMTAMGSSPNIASSGVASDTIAFGEHHLPPVSMASTVPHSLRQARDNTIMDLQTQLKEVLRENDLLRKDVEVKESKLSSSMNSIKTFWSPELKKERALRKDEASKITIWKEQYRVVQEENQHMQMTIQALQDELRIQRDLNQLFQQDSNSRTGEPCVTELTEENFQRLHTEHERQAKELFLLRKTLEEMELRIETQKQTLNARDESIKKLLEMLQSKGLSAKATEEDHERTRRLAEAEMHVHHLESLLEQKEKENALLREEMHRRFENAPDSAKTKALQTVIEMKDSKISSMERGLRDLEEEIQMLKSNGALSTEEREEEMKQMEVYRSHSKFMKNKIGQVKQELSRKDTELLALQTKLETLTNQFSDSKQHIEVLKESLTAKEQRAAILQTEVDALRLRLEEKETMLNKKTKQIQDMAEEKGTQAGEIHDLKDMLDVKERKVNVLQKKVIIETIAAGGGRVKGDEPHGQDVEGTICGVDHVGDLGEERQDGDEMAQTMVTVEAAQTMVTVEAAYLAFIELQDVGDGQYLSTAVMQRCTQHVIPKDSQMSHRIWPKFQVWVMIYVMQMAMTKMKAKKIGLGQGASEIVGWCVELPGKEDSEKHKDFGEDFGPCDDGKDLSKRDLEFLEGPRSQASGVSAAFRIS
ncbi:hypothetical protein EI555_021310 [Monodon monoceros]|uniref:ELKS/Rab6-interacting/CAST family member 1 n=1 Tax=Monodon monoceros TaxID=40151 RepID=A0A4U1F9D0_MONMO|nr:hypothetical protein EI555_021310 [Monodon monoceros]